MPISELNSALGIQQQHELIRLTASERLAWAGRERLARAGRPQRIGMGCWLARTAGSGLMWAGLWLLRYGRTDVILQPASRSQVDPSIRLN